MYSLSRVKSNLEKSLNNMSGKPAD
jgi:hypothetical protein